jgi:outer membrane protein
MTKRSAGLALLLVAASSLAHAQAAAQPAAQPAAQAAAQDLLQVLAQARASDPVLAQADAQRGLQHEASLQARAALWPQWQLTGSDSRLSDGGGRSRSVGSTVTQVLFDLSQLREWQAAQTASSAQEAAQRAASQALAARVATAYFGVLGAQAHVATAQAIAEAYQREWLAAQQRVAAGLVATVDMDQSRTYYELARGTAAQAQLLLADAHQALTQITGREPAPLRPLTRALQALAPQPAEAASWVDHALLANPNLQASALALQASEQRVHSARAAAYPSLSAALDTSRTWGAVTPAHPVSSQVAVRLTVPLFAGGALDSQHRQASLRRDIARAQLEATRRAVVRETRAQHHAMQAGVALLHSTQAAVQASERALASTRSGQSLGTRSTSDLLLAIQNLASAQAAHEQARHAYVLATLLLQQASGTLGDAELLAVNQLLESP